ncbi:hypothetical protein [Micromonospora sp. RV43]|uniref:hypothetical protein n=1 Tax=Micromonospora sp. RV43 TaxID=1661387 RepID=UPI00064C2F41|nr:hypothetical protein [Micromonospora sp. RV43]
MVERRKRQPGPAATGRPARDKLGTFKLPRVEWELFGVNAEGLETDRSAELLNFVRWVIRDPRAAAPRRPDASAPPPAVDPDAPPIQLGTFRLATAEWKALALASRALKSNSSAELLNFVRWFNHDPGARRLRRAPSRTAAPSTLSTAGARRPPAPEAASEEPKDALGTFRLPGPEWRAFKGNTNKLGSNRSAELLNLVRWVNHDPRGRTPRRPPAAEQS